MWTLAQLSAAFSQAALAWGGAVAVSIPIAIHLLTRYRRQIQAWGAMRFLAASFKKHRRRLRIEQLILLINRCLIVLLAGLAMSGPVLTGCTQWIHAAAGVSARMVHIVIDNSIASSATHDDQPAIERYKKFTNQLANQLNSSDRVVIWQAARSPSGVIRSEPLAPNQVQQHLAKIHHTHAKANLHATLTAIHHTLQQDQHPPNNTFIVMLSAFTRGSADTDRHLNKELHVLDQLANLFALKPAAPGGNIQITSITPSSPQVLTDATGILRTLSINVDLKRFADDTPGTITNVTLTAHYRGDPKPLITKQAQHKWLAGQSEYTLRIHLPVQALSLDDHPSNPDDSHATLNPIGLTVNIQSTAPNAPHDVITVDNVHRAIVCAREGISVSVVSDDIVTHSRHDSSSSAHWLLTALSPGNGPAPVTTSTISPTAISKFTLSGQDAVIVTHPQQLLPSGWEALRRFTDTGGVVWFIMPASHEPPLWLEPLRDTFHIEWHLRVQRLEVSTDQPTPWRLATTNAVPAGLEALSTEWESLLRPVRVYKHYEFDRRAPIDQLLLQIVDGSPLLLSASVGHGTLLLTTTAFDLDWTNLPAKPLFVPLLHETLRTHSARSTARWVQQIVSGDNLPNNHSRADTHPWIPWTINNTANPPNTENDYLQPAIQPTDTHATHEPGFFESSEHTSTRWMAVNPDTPGADTTPIPTERLKQWLAATGQWKWLGHTDAQSIVAQKAQRTSLGWPLLVSVVALVLLETCLARWFSHAAVPRSTTPAGHTQQGFEPTSFGGHNA